ncbi:hypothetical protein BH10CYA1_BH10CYA1_25710 [soil metagenome]
MSREKSSNKAKQLAVQESKVSPIKLVSESEQESTIASEPASNGELAAKSDPEAATNSDPEPTMNSEPTMNFDPEPATNSDPGPVPNCNPAPATNHDSVIVRFESSIGSSSTDWTSKGLIGKIEALRAQMDHAIFSKEGFAKYMVASQVDHVKYLWTMRAPIFLLAAIWAAPKVTLLWIVIVLLKPLCSLLYQRLPLDWQNKVIRSIPPAVKRSVFLRDMGEGANQCLPFILFWLYLCCAPFAVLWIAGHWVRGFLPSKPEHVKDGLVFGQNKKRDLAQPENNFYYSRAFGIVVVAFFALGVPAFFSYSLYQNLNVEKDVQTSPSVKIFGRASQPPAARKRGVFIGGYHKGHAVSKAYEAMDNTVLYQGENATYVTGYSGYWPWLRHLGLEPTKNSLFFVHFYLVSLGCALSVLFFRAWFFFPLNFLSDEHEIFLTASGIRRSTMNNWFLNVLTINRWGIGGGPDTLDWKEIKSLQHLEEGFTKLSPLPETAFKKESLTYKLLNKLASLIDGLTNRLNSGNYLVFSTTEKTGDFGRNLKINLNDLNREQRAKLFYSVKNWAPNVVIQPKAEELLLGSVVLQDVRYTQLWFDLLTCKTKVKRQSTLNPGETLRDGAYTIEERLSAGGQATAYLARNAAGTQIVLKEFILAIASTTGALIESAREFETEVTLLSQLNNPGIVRLEDFFTEDGRVYVVLEYVHGQTLRQKVQKDGPLSEAEVVRLTQAVCDVLEYLHNFDPPIVHRDVTPENILVLPDGTIKLIDFSLAVKNDGRSTTDSCGKQAFTPPEQFREEICPQSDIYGLGATMFFMLTGVPPKPITTSSPKTKAPETSDKLNKIVERATQLDLSQRYESVHWLKLDLSELTAKASVV